MITTDSHRETRRDRVRLRDQIIRQWRCSGRFDYSDSELRREIDRRLADLDRRRAACPQLQLPLMDGGQVAAATQRAACRATRGLRICRRAAIVDLLRRAGSEGLTRRELSEALGCEPGGVTSPVSYLLRAGWACEPFSRPCHRTGQEVAVITLTSEGQRHG